MNLSQMSGYLYCLIHIIKQKFISGKLKSGYNFPQNPKLLTIKLEINAEYIQR